MALFTGAFFVAQVSLIIVAKPFYAIFCTSVYLTSQKPGLLSARWWTTWNALERCGTQ